MKANDTPPPFDPATIPPQFRATAMIGREVRIVEWLPTPPAPLPPPRPTYRGPAQWGDERERDDAAR